MSPAKAAPGSSPLLGRPKLTPCNAWSPHEPGMDKPGHKGKPVPVQCNRPQGHDGNHMTFSRGSFDRLAEWTQSEVIL